MAQQSRIVAIGPREEILGLRTAGVETVCVETEGELLAALDKHVRQQRAPLVLISETVIAGALRTVDELRMETGTVILVIPSHRGSEGITQDWLRQRMELAIGVDLVSEK